MSDAVGVEAELVGAVPAAAWELLVEWLPPNDDPERPQITLSTVDADGVPDARTVLLTSFGPDGFTFNTDAASRKVAELRANPHVALTVLWPGFTRQIVVRGVAAPSAPEVVAAAYASRSPYLKQLAWLNTHEFAALPREERVERWAAFEAEHAADGFAQPEGWCGFTVVPTQLTFWHSNGDTASERLEFALVDGAWTTRALAG